MITERSIRIASIAGALGAIAVGLAVAWTRHEARVLSEPITREAPDLGPLAQELLPNLEGAVVYAPDRPHDPAEVRDKDRFRRIKRLRRFRVWTDARGLRVPEGGRVLKVPAPGFRILCVGDSVTFGWGVKYEQSWPVLLGKELGVESIDAGVPARKPDAMANWIARYARGLDPDLVLFTRRPDHMLPDPYESFARAVRQAVQAVAPVPLGVVLPPISTFDPRGRRDMAEEHREVQRLVAPVPVLELTPVFREALEKYHPSGVVLELGDGVERVVRLPDRAVILTAPAPADGGLAPQILQAFEDDPNMAEPYFFDGGHPDAEGLQIFASAVAAWVREEGWLPEATAGN